MSKKKKNKKNIGTKNVRLNVLIFHIYDQGRVTEQNSADRDQFYNFGLTKTQYRYVPQNMENCLIKK